jgi:hypothetical protein
VRDYGNKTEVYEGIVSKVMSERAVQTTVDGLRERWRMIMFMYEDCQDVIKKRKERELYRRKIKHQEEVLTLVALASAVLVPVLVTMFFVWIL